MREMLNNSRSLAHRGAVRASPLRSLERTCRNYFGIPASTHIVRAGYRTTTALE